MIWAYLGIIFEILTETVAWERWEGRSSTRSWRRWRGPYTSAAWACLPCSTACCARRCCSLVVALFFGLHFETGRLWTALVLLAVASVSFVGVGMVTAVLPLISPEKGAQFGFIAQGLLLVVSGVYYPVSVLPQWMQWLSKISPATYALRGIRGAMLDGDGIGQSVG